jgi:hypothetical protein
MVHRAVTIITVSSDVSLNRDLYFVDTTCTMENWMLHDHAARRTRFLLSVLSSLVILCLSRLNGLIDLDGGQPFPSSGIRLPTGGLDSIPSSI